MKNKNALITFNILAMIPRIIFLILAMIAIVILVRLFVVGQLDIDPVIADVFEHSLLYSPGGISFHDPLTGRIYPGVIDGTQFGINKLDLNKSLSLGNNRLIAARINLETFALEGKPIVVGYPILFYNEDWYYNWKPLADLNSNLKGLGKADYHVRTLPVVVRTVLGPYQGKLTIRMIIPRG
ncbi:hypothetical protein HN587_06560 [Candidatus Woesearchaeota archaeon]|nr:hypothetical protein [Candidatus Woesearchaeota archaeon]